VGGRDKEVSRGRKNIQKNIVKVLEKYPTVVAKCYRGFGKSTTFALLLPLYLVFSGRKKYIVLIASSRKASSKLIENITLQLLYNENLKKAYDFKLLAHNKQEITLQYNGDIIKFQGFGITSTDIRGLNSDGNRPDLVIADDLPNDKNVLSKPMRDELYDTFNTVLRGLSDREDKHFSILLLGTILHSDDLVSRVSQEPNTKVFSYPLITKFPNRMDLLEESYRQSTSLETFTPVYREVRTMQLDNDNLNKREHIYKYFQNTPYFERELQNNPTDLASSLSYSTFQNIPDNLTYYGSLDPSTGKKNGDMQGIGIVGVDNKNNKFIVYAKGFRVKPFDLLVVMEDLHTRFNFVQFGIETNQFQEVYADELIKRLRERGAT
jgi:hypothetical protein